MSLDRVQVLRMMPGVSESRLSLMMRVLEEEDRLQEANTAIVLFMRRHALVKEWGEDGLASSDMMTLEATRRLWNARIDYRTGNHAIGTYTHVLDQWGIAYDQPIVLNRRQAGAAIDGALNQRVTHIDRLAVDTHGYTDVAMGLAKLLGFDLCPRLTLLKDRKLYVPRNLAAHEQLKPILVPISMKLLQAQWDNLLRLAASVKEGWCTASQALGRLGSDARGDPLYQASVAFGRLVRTVYLCDHFTKPAFRDAIRRVLNHGEATHQLQRTIRALAIGPKRARSKEEQAAISGSLSLLANLVMAWNTQRMQALVGGEAGRGRCLDLAQLMELGPVSTRHINFRGTLHFPVEQFAEPIFGKEVPVARTAHG